VPYAPTSQDVAVLIGLLAVLVGEYLSGSVDDHLMRRMGDRFNREGLLAEHLTPTTFGGRSTP
jgi:hypothetical protein